MTSVSNLSNTPFQGKRWIDLFRGFVSELRINTKELVERDERGFKFDLWRSQEMYLEELAAGLEAGQRSFAFLKSRQCGITTISLAIDIFWVALFPGTRGALVTDTDANRQKFRIMIHNYIASFPRGFFGSSFNIIKGKNNKDYAHFSNGSTLDFLVAGKKKNETLGEGSGYSFMHSTETANYGSVAGLQSFRETLSDTNPQRLYIYESTAKGYGHWKDIYEEHLRDTLTKRACFVGWWSKNLNQLRKNGPAPEPRLFHIYGAQPPSPEEREKIKLVLQRHNHQITQEQLAWYRWRQSDESSSEDALNQNQPWYDGEAFVVSGASFFPVRSLGKDLARISHSTEPVLYEGYRFLLSNQFLESRMEAVARDKTLVELRVWEHPHPLGIYAIGVDPAWGRDGTGDNACISVWRCYADYLVQTAEYAVNMHDTRQIAWVLAYLAGAYRNCHINIEVSGGVGLAVISEFKSLRNQLQARQLESEATTRREQDWSDFLANARWFLYRRYDSLMAGSNVTQFSTTNALKWAVMNQLRDARNKEELIINSRPLTEELISVIHDTTTGRLAAPPGANDDRAMAAALACRTWIDMLRPNLVAQGATFERIQSGEFYDEDADPSIKTFIGKLAVGHFKRMEELDELQREENYAPKWMRDRGLA